MTITEAIKSVRVYALEAQIDEPFAFSQTWVDKRVGLVVEIETESGLVGWGDGYGPPKLLKAVIDNAYGPWLIGKNPTAGDAIWESLYNLLRDHGQRGLAIQALSAVDIALWDLRGKALGVPVHQLMGGPIRTEVHAYATGLYKRSKDQAENLKLLKQEAQGYLDAGFKAMKTKVGFGFEDDMATVTAISETIGDKARLFVDANHGCDLLEAKRLAAAMEPLDIGWFEEPVEPENLDDYVAMRAYTDIPIAGGECSFTRLDFKRIMDAKAMDIIQPDTGACGGLTEAKRIADMAWSYGVRYNPHVWGTGIGLAAALHLLAVLPTNAKAMRDDPINTGPLLEFDSTPHPFRQDLLVEPIAVNKGVATVPTGPGLGVEIKREVLERYQT